MNGEIFVRL